MLDRKLCEARSLIVLAVTDVGRTTYLEYRLAVELKSCVHRRKPYRYRESGVAHYRASSQYQSRALDRHFDRTHEVERSFRCNASDVKYKPLLSTVVYNAPLVNIITK
jgi:hypothetical protein